MLSSIYCRTLLLETLYFYRAIFHDAKIKGRSLPFYQNFIQKIER